MHGRQCPWDKPKFAQPESGFQSRVEDSSSIIGPRHNETISLNLFFFLLIWDGKGDIIRNGLSVFCDQHNEDASLVLFWGRELTPTVCHNSIIGDTAVKSTVRLSLLKDGCVAIAQEKKNAHQKGQGRMLLKFTRRWSIFSCPSGFSSLLCNFFSTENICYTSLVRGLGFPWHLCGFLVQGHNLHGQMTSGITFSCQSELLCYGTHGLIIQFPYRLWLYG